ncbi:MAG: hypothetical protein HQL18_02350 [Candidatus Omnitrophica bacterium]|nr:hypothetical protein [Candidatus Omnitrophota bacterium]
MKRYFFLAVFAALFLYSAAPAQAAAVVQRRVQQQKQMQAQMQAQMAQQYQQQMMAQQQAQQVAAYQQAQQAAAYQQAQQQYQQAAAQKAAEEYAAQKQAMEIAVAQKQAQEQQAAQAVQAVAQNQMQQAAAQYQQVEAYNNLAALNAYKQQQQLKAYQEAQAQAQLNGDIKLYAEYTMKRNALLRAQAAQTEQAETEKQLLAYASLQKANAIKKRAAMNSASQPDATRRALGKKAEADIMASPSATMETDSDNTISSETTVDIKDLWDALDRSTRPWTQIMDQEVKLLTVAEYIDRFRKGGVRISRPPGDYVKLVDALLKVKPDMLSAPFGNVLSYAAVVEYDFGNGKNKDELARQALGEADFWANKKRVEKR